MNFGMIKAYDFRISWLLKLIFITALFSMIGLQYLNTKSKFSYQISKSESNLFTDSDLYFELMVSLQGNKTHPRNDTILNWLESRRNIYRNRLEKINSVCQMYNFTTADEDIKSKIIDRIFNRPKTENLVIRVKHESFIMARSYRIMACYSPKVASSSFVTTFLSLMNINVKLLASPHSLAHRLRPVSQSEFEFVKKHYFKVLIVRNPMERLVSCYIDKVLDQNNEGLHDWQKAIKFLAKKISIKKDMFRASNVSFSSVTEKKFYKSPLLSTNHSIFSYFRSREEYSNLTIPNSLLGINLTEEDIPLLNEIFSPRDTPVVPTFSEFLEYILSTDLLGNGFSAHWAPFWRRCSPCSIDFDMVLKLETGEDDFKFLWEVGQLKFKVPIPYLHMKLSDTQNNDQTKEMKLKSFYSGVPRELLIRVYEAYKMDFLLFDYDFNEVLKLASYDPI